MQSEYWFRAKTYGWGWYPVTWQGFAIILLYALLLAQSFYMVDRYSQSVGDTLIGMIIPFVLLTALLIVVCYGTGEKPRWQWGKRKN